MKLFIQGIIVMLVFAFVLGMANGYLDLPIAHYSHEKGRIVKVEYADGSKTLNPSPEQIPKKYSQIEVK